MVVSSSGPRTHKISPLPKEKLKKTNSCRPPSAPCLITHSRLSPAVSLLVVGRDPESGPFGSGPAACFEWRLKDSGERVTSCFFAPRGWRGGRRAAASKRAASRAVSASSPCCALIAGAAASSNTQRLMLSAPFDAIFTLYDTVTLGPGADPRTLLAQLPPNQSADGGSVVFVLPLPHFP